ncbi:conjugal transfer protein TrbJ [Fusobacterium sp. PH5-44]|uniref:conjugal transfer protein TrbJ n=1 Tax=unclassified Fusobacterium TaxID=2648384 RepID=UPI003D1AD77C
MRKKLLTLGIFIFMFSSSIFAFGGSSSKGILKILTKIYDTELEIQLTQLEQLEAQLTEMESMAGALTSNQLVQIQQGLQEVMDIQNSFESTISQYSDFQNQFKGIYNDFKDFKNLSPDEYLSKANDLLSNSKKIYKDAMKMVGISSPDKLGSDAAKIQTIMRAANTAEGQKAVLQASTQLAAHQLQTLGELRTLMGQSLQAQSAYMLEQSQTKAIEIEAEKAFMQEDTKDYRGYKVKSIKD